MSTVVNRPKPDGIKPWEVDLLPDLFGFHLHVDGRRFFIPEERFDQVLILMAYWSKGRRVVLFGPDEQVGEGE